jgi:murein endopeptidase
VPLLAKPFGRVPLPIFLNEAYPVRPANLITCLGNRHYVKPELLKLIKDVSKEINEGKKDKTEILYLDASFPFIDNFPLLPHKSHDDGEKLDICFLFKEKKSQKRVNEPMSFFGYGACIEPEKGETNMPAKCSENGYFQYNLIKMLTSQSKIKTYEFDEKANRALLLLLSRKKATGKIFIEPHLKERLKLKQDKKIRFHGCGAVRHDDHIHLQL